VLLPDLRTLIRQGGELEDHFDALSDSSPEFEKCVADIRAWLGLCVDYGRFLPDPSPNRRALQGRVDYWTSVLSQRGHSVLEIDRVAEFDPEAGSPLEVDFPYPGLTAYDAKDRALYSGREREASQSVAHLERHRALLLVSESGGGKSSLALASILPRLNDAHPDWLFAPRMTPGAHPIGALSRTLRTTLPLLPADFIQTLARFKRWPGIRNRKRWPVW
jgi:hypothetical protein